jgi:hypothetical protein
MKLFSTGLRSQIEGARSSGHKLGGEMWRVRFPETVRTVLESKVGQDGILRADWQAAFVLARCRFLPPKTIVLRIYNPIVLIRSADTP